MLFLEVKGTAIEAALHNIGNFIIRFSWDLIEWTHDIMAFSEEFLF